MRPTGVAGDQHGKHGLKAEDEADSMTILFEGSKQDTVADFGKSQGATKKTVGLGTCTSSPFPD
jgi:hypothetical protein